MKKILLLLVGLLSLAPTFAQSDGEEDFIPTKKEKNNVFFIGLKAGGVMTSMSDPDEGKLADGSGFGMSRQSNRELCWWYRLLRHRLGSKIQAEQGKDNWRR